MRRTDYILFTATIVALSGTRIGGSDDLLQIGGADMTVIKHPVTLQPYIPGSSIKGKIRSELEKSGAFNSRATDAPCGCEQCLVCRVFGPHLRPKHNLGPTRIVVRDAPAIGEARIETKASTAINRETGAAFGGSLRTEERVVEGSKFGLEIGMQVFDCDERKDLLDVLRRGVTLLELSGIGAGVGKGNGRIRLEGKRLLSMNDAIAALEPWPAERA